MNRRAASSRARKAVRAVARGARPVLGAVLLIGSPSSCGGASPTATVFDPSGAAQKATVDVDTHAEIETAVPALNGVVSDGGRWFGVSVLHGAVRFARPANWRLRDASLEGDTPWLRYISPRAYSFAIYVREDAPRDGWPEILDRYEAGLRLVRAKALGTRSPTATLTNQGRTYTVDRTVDGKDAILSRSREILLRGVHHVVLVQIVTSDEDLGRLADELIELIRHIEVD